MQADAFDAVPLGNAVPVPKGPGPVIPFDLKDTYKRNWLHLKRKEHRWLKLIHGFGKSAPSEDGVATYDVTKIPDIWDNLYYDLLSHRSFLSANSVRLAEKMADLLHPLNEWVCLSEFGISEEEKLRIGTEITWRLIGKVLGDLEFMFDQKYGAVDEAGKLKSVARKGDDASMTSAGRDDASMTSDSVVQNTSSNGMVATCGGDASRQRACSQMSGITSAFELAQKGMLPAPAVKDDEPQVPDSGFSFEPQVRQASRGNSGLSPISVTEDVEQLVANSATNMVRMSSQKEALKEASTPTPGSSKRSKHLSRLTPELRQELKHALRDKADWHPRLSEQVGKITDIKDTKIVKSRVYVTSASTMHSLFNILRHWQHVEGEHGGCSKDIQEVSDLNYLTHLVFRCYEKNTPADEQPNDSASKEDDCRSPALPTSASHGGQETDMGCAETTAQLRQQEKAKYRVEIAMSPGVQVFKSDGGHLVRQQWPSGEELTGGNCMVAPLQTIAESALSPFEHFFQEVVSKYGGQRHEDEEDEEKASDLN